MDRKTLEAKLAELILGDDSRKQAQRLIRGFDKLVRSKSFWKTDVEATSQALTAKLKQMMAKTGEKAYGDIPAAPAIKVRSKSELVGLLRQYAKGKVPDRGLKAITAARAAAYQADKSLPGRLGAGLRNLTATPSAGLKWGGNVAAVLLPLLASHLVKEELQFRKEGRQQDLAYEGQLQKLQSLASPEIMPHDEAMLDAQLEATQAEVLQHLVARPNRVSSEETI